MVVSRVVRGCFGFSLSIAILVGARCSLGAILPEDPRERIDTKYPTQTGRNILVRATDDLQAAIDQATGGDTILLEAGATYEGNFLLRKKATTGTIVIRTGTADSLLPRAGQRVTPTSRPLLARVQTPNVAPVFRTEAGAKNYRLFGLELTMGPSAPFVYNLVLLDGSPNSSIEAMPSDIIIDRSYIHADPARYCKRGVAMNGRRLAVIDSYINDIQTDDDASAVGGWDGTGPYRISNNYLSSTGENIAFGGALPVIPGTVISDVVVEGNHIFKPLSWKTDDPTYAGRSWCVKNLFEIKTAKRVLVEGNVFENSWANCQVGFAILLTVRTENGVANWASVEDITFRRNWIRNAGAGFNITSSDDGLNIGEKTARVLIEHNVIELLGPEAKWGNYGIPFQLLWGPQDITIRHNTIAQTGMNIAMMSGALPRFEFTDNIAPFNSYGFFCLGGPRTNEELAVCAPGALLRGNVIIGSNLYEYLSGTVGITVAEQPSDVGFVNYSASDYRLLSTSRFNKAAADGTDIGADVIGVQSGRDRAISGNGADIIASSFDFSLSTAPASLTIAAGAFKSCSSSVTPINGFMGTVTFRVDGLPAGATGVFASNSVTASGSTILTISTTAAVQPGTYSLIITATSQTAAHVTSVSLVVTPPPTFTLAVGSVSQTVVAGTGTSFGVTVAPLNGFVGAVSLQVSGLPAGATAMFSPNNVTTPGNTTLTVSTTSETPSNTYILSIRATSGTVVQTSAVSLVVMAAPVAPPPPAVYPAPVISRISPTSVAAGAVTLTVNGSDFLAGSVVKLNGTASTTTFVSSTKLTASGPVLAGTTALQLTVGNPDGQVSNVVSIAVAAQPPAAPVTITITPNAASLMPSQTIQFTATVRQTPDSRVTWKVNGVVGGNSTLGTITSTGLYTAPASRNERRVEVRAASVVDSSKIATATVIIGTP
jgi:hypothetical protein